MKNDTDTAALLPCPFCGGEAEMREWDFPYVRYQSRCVACKTTGRTRFNERAKAIAAWNRRTPLPAKTGELRGIEAVPDDSMIESIMLAADCGPHAARAVLTALQPALTAAREEGRRDERAEVVAMLRTPDTRGKSHLSVRDWLLTNNMALECATAIERGEHDTGKEG